MQRIEQAFRDVCKLHETVAHAPAPEIGPQAFLPFPPGVDPVSYAIEEVAHLKQLCRQQQEQVSWVPRSSIFAGDSTVCFVVELPGVNREDVTITLDRGELVLRGQRRPPAFDGSVRPMIVEQAWGAFERRFPLPAWCTPDAINARYSQGMLEVSITRPDESAPSELHVEID